MNTLFAFGLHALPTSTIEITESLHQEGRTTFRPVEEVRSIHRCEIRSQLKPMQPKWRLM
eukprot:3073115-Alexandrium_andersonii.AAC.1